MPRLPMFLTRGDKLLPGVKRIISVPNPAAGADWSVGPDGGKQWRLIAAAYLFTASVQVANRNMGFQYLHGADVIWDSQSSFNEVAGSTPLVRVAGGQALGLMASENGRFQIAAPLMWLPNGCTLGSATANIQTNDQYSKVILYVEEAWVDDADVTDVLDTIMPLSSLAQGGK